MAKNDVRDRFARAMGYVGAAVGVAPSKLTLDVFWLELQAYPIEQVEAAAQEVARTHKMSTFPPLSTFVELLSGEDRLALESAARKGFESCLFAMMRGDWSEVDPAAKAAAESMCGSLGRFGMWDVEDRSRRRQEFVRYYVDEARFAKRKELQALGTGPRALGAGKRVGLRSVAEIVEGLEVKDGGK